MSASVTSCTESGAYAVQALPADPRPGLERRVVDGWVGRAAQHLL